MRRPDEMGMAGAVILALGIAGTGVAMADTPASPAAPVNQEPLGWGPPRDGLRLGLLPAVPEPELHYGDVFTFAVHVRNETLQPAQYKIWSTEEPELSLIGGRRIRLETAFGPVTDLNLAPGQDAVIPGDQYRVKIVRPGEDAATPPSAAATNTAPADITAPAAVPQQAAPVGKAADPTALPLLPGEYTVECTEALRVADKDDPNRATTLQARPGVLRFKITAAPGDPDAEPAPASEVGGGPAADLVWGEPVDGLQAGIATDRPKGDVPAELRDELKLVFYVRNLGHRKVAIQYPQYGEMDWSLDVRDEQGAYKEVRRAFFDGLIPLATRTLAPGEVAVLGQTRLKRAAQAPPPNEVATVPTLVGDPGKYTVASVDDIRFADDPHLNLVLITGKLAFQIPGNG